MIPIFVPTPLRYAAGWVVLALLAGCEGGSRGQSGTVKAEPGSGPSISVVDSVVLQEPGDAPLGGFTSFWARAPSGRIYIADITNRRVAVFSEQGRYLRDLGKAGEGPGELLLPVAAIPLPSRGAIAVVDANRQRMLVFREETGELLAEYSPPFRQVGGSTAQLSDDRLVFVSATEQTPFFLWEEDSSVMNPFGDPIELSIPAWQMVAMSSGTPGVVLADSLLVTWQPATGLWLYDLQGHLRGNILVPARRRQGEGQANIAEQLRLRDAGSDSLTVSAAIGLGRNGTGQILVASQDVDRIRLPNGAARETNIRPYVSVIDAGWKRSCVDGNVPVTTDISAPIIFDGENVYYLARRVEESDQVLSVVYKLRIDLTSCDWAPMEVRAVAAPISH